MKSRTAGKWKRFPGALVGALGALLLSGCLVSDNRLPANEAPAADSPLLGFWQAPWPALLTRDTLNVLYVSGRDHYYAVRGRGKYLGADTQGGPIEMQNIRQYRAYPSRLDGRLFFSLVPVRGDRPVYVILEAVLQDGGRKLVVRGPSEEAVERAIAEGRLPSRIEEDSPVATAAPEALAAWLATLGPGDFKVRDTFERWPAPVDDLDRRLSGRTQ